MNEPSKEQRSPMHDSIEPRIYTISAPGKELETREQAKKILKEHNAYDLHFFGQGAVQDL